VARGPLPSGSAALGAMRPQAERRACSRAPSLRGRSSYTPAPGRAMWLRGLCHVGVPPSARCGFKLSAVLVQGPLRCEGAAPTVIAEADVILWECRPRRDRLSIKRCIAARAQLPHPSPRPSDMAKGPLPCGSAALGAMRLQAERRACSRAPSLRGCSSHTPAPGRAMWLRGLCHVGVPPSARCGLKLSAVLVQGLLRCEGAAPTPQPQAERCG
jgi:hypothetical protein